MQPLARVLRRIRYFLQRREMDRATEEELRFHIDMETEKNLRAGMTPGEARRRAMIAFGGVDRHVEETRRARGTMALEDALTGAALILRGMRRRPLYAVGVCGTLALGLGAALITFTVAWKIWLARMPYPDPDGVLRLYEVEPPTGAAVAEASQSRRHLFSEPLAADFHEHDWQTMAAFSTVFRTPAPDRPTRTVDGTPHAFSSVSLTADGFEIFGITPIIGRLPDASEEDEPAEVEVMLSERRWRESFGSDPNILGTRMFDARPENAGYSERIVGVARIPSGYPGDADLLFADPWREQAGREFRWREMVGRLKTGYAAAQAEQEMSAFVASLAEIQPEHRGWTIAATVLSEDLIRPFRGVFALLLAAGAVFLLLAAVNVTGLVAARRMEARHDRGIRLALGATETRLLRASLGEGMLLAAVGAIGGAAVAPWLMGPLKAMLPPDVPRLAELSLSPSIVIGGVCIGLGLGAVIGAGAYLMSRASRSEPGRIAARRSRGVPSRRAVVIGQVALTTLLTAGGAAVIHRVSSLEAVDLGFRAEGVSMMSGDLGARSYAERTDAVRSILDQLDARGITAAFAFNTPMDGLSGTEDLPVFSLQPDAASAEVFYELQLVTEEYFTVMGVELLAGRPFLPSDGPSSGSVAIVSEDFARDYLPAGSAPEEIVGRSLDSVVLMRGPTTVVGVVESTRHEGPDVQSPPNLYVPYSQQRTIAFATLLIRDEDGRAEAAATDVLARVTPDVRWSPSVPYTEYWDRWFSPFRLQLVVIAALMGLGLLLASVGLYSLLAYQVLMSRREIGIRKAVGARDGSLVAGVVRRGMGMAAAGGAIGLLAWYQAAPSLHGLVEGIDSAGAVVPLAVLLVVGGSSLVATLAPGLKAARVDPAVTLRAD